MSTSLISNTSTSAEFGQQFNEIFEQTIEMFVVPEFVTAGNQHESDVEKIRMAVDRVKISTDRSKGIMEAARKELQSRFFLPVSLLFCLLFFVFCFL